MHNLNDDPYELHNLAFQRAYFEQRCRLHKLLRQWLEQTGDQFTLPEL